MTGLALAALACACSRDLARQPSGVRRAAIARPAAASPPPTAIKPMQVGNGVTAPVPVKRVEPKFEACRGQKLWGFPILELHIDEHGKPAQIRALKPMHPCLEKVVVAALEQWEFRPATYQGKPVPVIFHVTMNIRWA